MSDLPPPSPGPPVGQPGWQPPAGPPPAPPSPPSPPSPPPPAGPAPIPPTAQLPAQPTAQMPTQLPGRTEPPAGTPPTGGPKRSRVPAILGALVAVAVGFAAVLWLTRGGDDEEERSDDTEQPDETVAPTPATTAPDTTVAETTPPTTAVPLTLPSTVAPTAPPTTVPATEPAVTVTVPANATLYTDPAGWSILVDPTWTFEQSPGFTGWFTNTGTAGFGDNVNVVTEDFSQPFTLDQYVEAAKAQIVAQAADAQVMDERRVVGQDGVEVQLVTWSGTLPGLPTLVFLQAVTVTTERAYIATFTTEPGRMRDLAPVIGPYLSSIRPA